jgi:hypothetical protein
LFAVAPLAFRVIDCGVAEPVSAVLRYYDWGIVLARSLTASAVVSGMRPRRRARLGVALWGDARPLALGSIVVLPRAESARRTDTRSPSPSVIGRPNGLTMLAGAAVCSQR